MVTTKKIDLGEYVVVIEYNKITGTLDVTVMDELEGVIETINVTNDEEPEGDDEINPNLN